MRRYIMIGVGAVGGTVGARLSQHQVPVVWVARGEHGKVLRDGGLTLRTPDGTIHAHAPVWAGPQDAELTEDDVLVVCVKTQDVVAALAQWADLPVRRAGEVVGRAGELLPVLTLTNGVSAEDMALRYAERVYGVCVWCPAGYLQPGEVACRFSGASAVLHTSRYPVALTDDTDREFLADLSATWGAAQIDVPLPQDVMPWKYRKLVTNMINAVDALLGESDTAIIRACAAEARTVLTAAGIAPVDESEERSFREGSPRMADPEGAVHFGSSTWQSLTKGSGAVETDYLNGEIVRLAHLTGTPAPLNTTIASLVRRAAREGARPGQLGRDDLRRALGLPLDS